MNDESANDTYTMDGWLALNGKPARSIHDNGFDLEYDGIYQVFAYDRDGKPEAEPIATFDDRMAAWYRRHGALLEARLMYHQFDKIRSVNQMLGDTQRIYDLMQAYDLTDDEVCRDELE